MAIGFQTQIFQKFPQLKSAIKIKNWNLFCTVSATYAAFIRSGTFVKDRKLIGKLDEIVLNKLELYNPNGPGAFQDLENFLSGILNQNQNDITPELMESYAGAWIIWNLTDKEPIDEESVIASVLGKMFFSAFANYYEM